MRRPPIPIALGKSMPSDERRHSLLAILFHIMFWRMELEYFGRGLLGSCPQADIGIVLWSLSHKPWGEANRKA